jgi:group I intron endonuclease
MAKELLKGIYKISNIINGKFYIGSSNDIKDRWREHICQLNQNKHHNKHLQRAWNKYGAENFEFNIIEYVENEDDLLKIEQRWLDETKCYNREIGYNVSKTAAGCSLYGEENGFYGKKHNEKTKEHWSEIRKTMYNGKDNPMYGKKHSKETISKISEANTGNTWTEEQKKQHSERISGINNGNHKKIICTTTGKIFDLIKQAGEYYNIPTDHITDCCKGRRSFCGKLNNKIPLQWMYYDDYLKYGINKPDIKYIGKRKVICITTGKIFNTIKEAAEEYNIKNKSPISRCCKNKAKSAGKHPETGEPLRWMYYENYINQSEQTNN